MLNFSKEYIEEHSIKDNDNRVYIKIGDSIISRGIKPTSYKKEAHLNG